MTRFAIRSAVVAALGVAIVAFASSGTTSAANADDPIKEAMKKINGGGKGSVCATLNQGVKAKEPKWDELAEKSKIVVPLAKAMIKAKPPVGEDASWEKYSTAYAKAAEDLDAAIAAKDAKAASTAMKTITACGGCHGAHKPKK